MEIFYLITTPLMFFLAGVNLITAINSWLSNQGKGIVIFGFCIFLFCITTGILDLFILMTKY